SPERLMPWPRACPPLQADSSRHPAMAGVEGLDDILRGGFTPNRLYLETASAHTPRGQPGLHREHMIRAVVAELGRLVGVVGDDAVGEASMVLVVRPRLPFCCSLALRRFAPRWFLFLFHESFSLFESMLDPFVETPLRGLPYALASVPLFR